MHAPEVITERLQGLINDYTLHLGEGIADQRPLGKEGRHWLVVTAEEGEIVEVWKDEAAECQIEAIKAILEYGKESGENENWCPGCLGTGKSDEPGPYGGFHACGECNEPVAEADSW